MRVPKRVLVSAVAITGVAAIAIPMATAQAATAACELENLEKPDNSGYVFVNAMDPTGAYVVGSHTNGEGDFPQVWRDGQREAIEVNGAIATARDVNSSGQVIGYYTDDDSDIQTAYVYQDGQAQDLAIPDDPNIFGSWAVSINEDGVIAGAIIDFDGLRQPAYWPSTDDEAVLLPENDDAVDGFVRDVDEDGRMVGQHRDSNNDNHPYIWDAEGNGAELPGLEAGYADTLAGDYIIGANGPSEGSVPVMWTGEEDPQLIEDFDSVYDVASDGTIAGIAPSKAAAYQELGGEIVELPRMSDPDPDGWDSVQTISADGTVFAGNVNGGANRTDHHPAMWHCA